MKETLTGIARSFVSALITAAFGALAIALMLTLYDMPRTVFLAFVSWGTLLLAQAVLNELLIRHDPPLLLFLLLNAAMLFWGSEQIAARTVFTPASSGFLIFLRLCIWLSGLTGALACRKEPGSNVFVRLSDTLILCTGIYMASTQGLGKPFIPSALALALAALALSLLLTASLRAGGESDSVVRGVGIGGYLVLFALLALCMLLAGGLLVLGSGRVDGIVNAFLAAWDLFGRVAMAAMTALGFLLAYLFGNRRMMEQRQITQQDSPAYQDVVMEELGAAPQWVSYLIMGLLAACAVALLFAVIWAMRGKRFGRIHRAKSHRRITRTSRIGETLRAWANNIAQTIAFELRYRANRKTPQGLYVLALRCCRVKRLPRRTDESPGAYIRRLHGILLAQKGLSTLDRLADMLDRALYGDGKPHLSRGEADAMAAQIRSIAAPPLIRLDKADTTAPDASESHEKSE
ncbi:MAG: hypothetical protein IJB85_06120 [Clostridia bacterium]|nr:hypothetical protein [Clostridia bacterium]